MGSRVFLGGILLVIGLLFPMQASACSCGSAGPFLKAAPRTELIVRAKVLDYQANSMNVEVLEVLQGATKSMKIRIWGDNGRQCRPYVSAFPLGTEWILAVSSNPPPPEASTAGDYVISICGVYSAKVENGNAVGRLNIPQSRPDDKPEVMSLADLREALKKVSK